MPLILGIIASLLVALAIIRFSPLRGILERIDRERPQREAQTAEEIRLRPLTFVLTLIFVLVCAFGLIFTFAFSDTTQEKWNHFYVAFSLSALSGTFLAFAKHREDRSPFSLTTRRRIWGGILVCYALALVFILKLGASPFTRAIDSLRLLCYLGSSAPLAFAAWQLLNSREER